MQVFADPPMRQIALIGETYAATRAIMVEGPSGLLAVSPDAERPRFFPSRNLLVWSNGAEAQIFASTAPEALRGPQFDGAWCDELAKWKYPEATWDMLQFAMRLGQSPKQMITTTPRPMPLLEKLMREPLCVVTRASSHANAAHLAPNFLRDIIGRYEGTRLGRQEIDGEILQEQSHGLWSSELLARQKCPHPPTLQRIVMGLDPAVSIGVKANACGLIVAGQAASGEVYVLADETRQGLSPLNWARHLSAAYHRHEVSLLVAEVNQGGALIRDLILQEDPDIEFKAVRADARKVARAAPIVAFYERGLVFHTQTFRELEDEMVTYRGLGPSPDRLDALVWAVGELLLNRPENSPQIRAL